MKADFSSITVSHSEQMSLIGGEQILGPGIPEGFPSHVDYTQSLLSRQIFHTTPGEAQAVVNARYSMLGVGSIGGPLSLQLARMGAWQFRFADLDRLAFSNGNRQAFDAFSAYREDYKVDVIAQSVFGIQPYANVIVHRNGVDRNNPGDLEQIVKESDVVGWGLDDPQIIWEMNRWAKEYGKIVVSGLDLGPWSYMRILDYRDPNKQVLDGLVTEQDAREMKDRKFAFLAKTVAGIGDMLPVSLLEGVIALGQGEIDFFPQTQIAAQVFAPFAAEMVAKSLGKERSMRNEVLFKPDYMYLQPHEVANLESRRLELKQNPVVKAVLGI
jgi:molybdopterin/thiamine biosynthesis adenylyltransferase